MQQGFITHQARVLATIWPGVCRRTTDMLQLNCSVSVNPAHAHVIGKTNWDGSFLSCVWLPCHSCWCSCLGQDELRWFFQLFGCEALLQEIFMGIDRCEKKETVAFTVCIVKVLLAAQKNVKKYRHERSCETGWGILTWSVVFVAMNCATLGQSWPNLQLHERSLF